MKRFLTPARLWGTPGGPDEDWIRPHVLWLPQHLPQVLAYFHQLRQIVDAYPDVVTPVADENLHCTIQSIKNQAADGQSSSPEHLKTASRAIQHHLADLEPFDIEIGPASLSGSAATAAIWPEDGPAELNKRVRTGLLEAGLVLPPPEEHFWPHISVGYGNQDCHTPRLATRADELASALVTGIRPGIRTTANIRSVWLVWERQDVPNNTYTFTPVHELHLG
ncbi:2'-5' RNA ligase family protein [Streptomyces sp. ME19-01-6]|uniref:2'-5' RNA ligase family protein n=1 Tax=Streptomyces sp. ME19-01-6 TaxID=3028686 RepID=UPI0029B633E9|nr:2'-5' RNA ligase family protein [Streptomyces sp. ME19-01-6]MDX3224491.1 2'-5' RNA ligase family protein [Streptomyces sp. ME19-01-6]